MKKKIWILLFIIILCVLGLYFYLSGNRLSIRVSITKNNDSSAVMSKREIVDKLSKVNSHITDLWNNVFCEVKWYTDEGTSAIGEALDMDFVLENIDKYYNKVKDDRVFIDSLDDDYGDIKNAFYKMLDKATIIYNNIKSESPKPKTKISYRTDIELFNQYQQYIWETIVDMVNEEYDSVEKGG